MRLPETRRQQCPPPPSLEVGSLPVLPVALCLAITPRLTSRALLPVRSDVGADHAALGEITRGPQSPPPFPVVARVQIGERLPVGVTDDVAAGYLVDAPWCGETAGCFSASRAEFHLGDEPPVAIMSPACLAGPSYGCRRKGVKSRGWKICCWTWYTGSGELSPFSHASLGSLTAILKETPSLKRLQVSCLSACGRPQSIFSTGGPSGPQKPPLRFPRPDHRRAVRVLHLEPVTRRARPVGRAQPLRHDALQAHAAGVDE